MVIGILAYVCLWMILISHVVTQALGRAIRSALRLIHSHLSVLLAFKYYVALLNHMPHVIKTQIFSFYLTYEDATLTEINNIGPLV